MCSDFAVCALKRALRTFETEGGFPKSFLKGVMAGYVGDI